jgi:hypothetical protein
MVGATGSPALTPPKGPTIDVFYVDGGHTWISIRTHQGAHHQCFFVLMVGGPRSRAPAPPRGPTINVFYVDGGRFLISVSTRQGGSSSMFLSIDDVRFWISGTAS